MTNPTSHPVVWKSKSGVITAEELIVELQKAQAENDEPGIRLLRGMRTDMGAKDKYPEYFL